MRGKASNVLPNRIKVDYGSGVGQGTARSESMRL
jgi:hypothetical protein